MIACDNGNVELVKLFLNLKVDVNIQNKEGANHSALIRLKDARHKSTDRKDLDHVE